jgi:hypothetical protein
VGYLLILASLAVNVLGQRTLVVRVRARHGVQAGDQALAVVQIVAGALLAISVSLSSGFFWWGAGTAAVCALGIAGTALYRSRLAKRSARRPGHTVDEQAVTTTGE